MKGSRKALESEAIALAPEERARLAELLLESLHQPIAEIEAAWAGEVAARKQAYEHGELEMIDAEDVLADAHSRTR